MSNSLYRDHPYLSVLVTNTQGHYAVTAARVMMLLGVLTTLGLSIYHYRQPEPFLIDLVFPPALCLMFIIGTATSFRHPQLTAKISGLFTLATAFLVIFPSLHFTTVAASDEALRFIDIFPPIPAIYIPVLIAVATMFRPRFAVTVSLVSWMLFVTPMIWYFSQFPEELLEPRGMDMVVLLGPITVLTVCLMILLHGMYKHFDQLRSQTVDLKNLSEKDSLTGLLNRRAGDRILRQLADQGDSFSAILFDLDHFKNINDNYGHDVGDVVLREVAKRTRTHTRKDDWVIRWGGEEFLLIAKGTTLTEGQLIAEGLRRGIAEKPVAKKLNVTASFGVADYAPGDTPDSIIKKADVALYESKENGRNLVTLAPDGEPDPLLA